PEFTFDGKNDAEIPINAANTQFETKRDALGWVYNTGAYWLRSKIYQPKHAFPWADDVPSLFTYPLRNDAGTSTIALFSDFGTGLYHSRYIARHIAAARPHHAVHLGDVYYAGKQSEFASRFIAPLEPILTTTEFFAMNGNHEMFSGATPYFAF